MFSRLKSAVLNRLPEAGKQIQDGQQKNEVLRPKFPYGRPIFLDLQPDEVQVSADHEVRPIIVPRDVSLLAWNTGYAEAVNAGKSSWNEDQASLHRETLVRSESRDWLRISGESRPGTTQEQSAAVSLPYTYFGMFDGHAGYGASLAASRQLHGILHQKLVDVLEHLIPPLDGMPSNQVEGRTKRGISLWLSDKDVPLEPIIIGALESAFWEMDQLIAKDQLNEKDQLISEERPKYKLRGGCTAIVALFILGKLYVANAGDSRAVLIHNGTATPMSYDHTPESERHRIRKLAALKPELLGDEFTHLDFFRRPFTKDLGKSILYRDANMVGWAYKTITTSDLKHPVVWGEGKRSRVMATIGVTRGFGDHDLKAINTVLPIKPFLLSQPEVRILDIFNKNLTENDVLLMATDGLWDVISNERAAEIIQTSLNQFPANDLTQLKHRFTTAAQYLVMNARGKRMEPRSWRLSDGGAATTDDISVFVIPLAPYKVEYTAWKREDDNIRAMYDGGNEGTRYGKLSLMSSPVGSKRNMPNNLRGTVSETTVNNGLAKKDDENFGPSPIGSKHNIVNIQRKTVSETAVNNGGAAVYGESSVSLPSGSENTVVFNQRKTVSETSVNNGVTKIHKDNSNSSAVGSQSLHSIRNVQKKPISKTAINNSTTVIFKDSSKSSAIGSEQNAMNNPRKTVSETAVSSSGTQKYGESSSSSVIGFEHDFVNNQWRTVSETAANSGMTKICEENPWSLPIGFEHEIVNPKKSVSAPAVNNDAAVKDEENNTIVQISNLSMESSGQSELLVTGSAEINHAPDSELISLPSLTPDISDSPLPPLPTDMAQNDTPPLTDTIPVHVSETSEVDVSKTSPSLVSETSPVDVSETPAVANDSDPPADVSDPPANASDPPADVSGPPANASDPPANALDPPADVSASASDVLTS